MFTAAGGRCSLRSLAWFRWALAVDAMSNNASCNASSVEPASTLSMSTCQSRVKRCQVRACENIYACFAEEGGQARDHVCTHTTTKVMHFYVNTTLWIGPNALTEETCIYTYIYTLLYKHTSKTKKFHSYSKMS